MQQILLMFTHAMFIITTRWHPMTLSKYVYSLLFMQQGFSTEEDY